LGSLAGAAINNIDFIIQNSMIPIEPIKRKSNEMVYDEANTNTFGCDTKYANILVDDESI
jgi:hypothetical protein